MCIRDRSKRSFERYGHEDMSVRAENTWTFSFLLWHLLRDQARSVWNAGTTSPVISDGDVPSHTYSPFFQGISVSYERSPGLKNKKAKIKMSDGHRSGRSAGRVSCKSTELKRCSVIEMRWNEVSLKSLYYYYFLLLIFIILFIFIYYY